MDWDRIEPRLATMVKTVVAPVYLMLLGAYLGVGFYARSNSVLQVDRTHPDRVFTPSSHFVSHRIAVIYYAITVSFLTLTALLTLLRAFAKRMDANRK
jgi:hypothetical protein